MCDFDPLENKDKTILDFGFKFYFYPRNQVENSFAENKDKDLENKGKRIKKFSVG